MSLMNDTVESLDANDPPLLDNHNNHSKLRMHRKSTACISRVGEFSERQSNGNVSFNDQNNNQQHPDYDNMNDSSPVFLNRNNNNNKNKNNNHHQNQNQNNQNNQNELFKYHYANHVHQQHQYLQSRKSHDDLYDSKLSIIPPTKAQQRNPSYSLYGGASNPNSENDLLATATTPSTALTKRKASGTVMNKKNGTLELLTNDLLEKILKLIRHSVKIIEKNSDKMAHNQAIYEEWKEVATRVDFILFIMSATVVVTSPIILFGRFYVTDSWLQQGVGCSCPIR